MEERARLKALEALFDPTTTARIVALPAGRGRDRSRGVAGQPVRPDDDSSGNYGYRRHLSANMGTEGRAIAVGNAPNDAVEQALSKTSLAELVRSVG